MRMIINPINLDYWSCEIP